MKFIVTYFARRKDAVRHVHMNGSRFSFDDLDEICFWIDKLNKRYDVEICTTRYLPLCKFTKTSFCVYPEIAENSFIDIVDILDGLPY